MHHMTANWSPIAQDERNQDCFGVWGIVGTTRNWPGVLNIWEEQGFAGLATSFEHEFEHPTLQDPKLAKWWSEAAGYRRRGEDRVRCARTSRAGDHDLRWTAAPTVWPSRSTPRSRASTSGTS